MIALGDGADDDRTHSFHGEAADYIWQELIAQGDAPDDRTNLIALGDYVQDDVDCADADWTNSIREEAEEYIRAIPWEAEEYSRADLIALGNEHDDWPNLIALGTGLHAGGTH